MPQWFEKPLVMLNYELQNCLSLTKVVAIERVICEGTVMRIA